MAEARLIELLLRLIQLLSASGVESAAPPPSLVKFQPA